LPRALKRILVVRTDRLGDVILTLPMLARLRQCFPEASLAMLLQRYTGAIVEGHPHAGTLLWYDDQRGLVPFGAMLKAIRAQRFDAVVLAHPTLRLALLMWLARIPLRVGTGYRYYSSLFNARVYEHRKDAKRHELEYNMNLLAELGCGPMPEGNWSPEFGLEVPEAETAAVRSLLRSSGVRSGSPLVVVHPGSGGSAREWPLDDFAALSLRLANELKASVVVTGSSSETAAAESIARRSGGVSLAGRLTLKGLAALLRAADLVVANSTGPLHLAVAVGTPVLGFYPQITAMSASRWGPYTDRKRVLVPNKPLDCRDCSGKKGEPCACMMSISVDEAFHAVCELLDEQKSRHLGMLQHG
jgi:heptosyltransferase III